MQIAREEMKKRGGILTAHRGKNIVIPVGPVVEKGIINYARYRIGFTFPVGIPIEKVVEVASTRCRVVEVIVDNALNCGGDRYSVHFSPHSRYIIYGEFGNVEEALDMPDELFIDGKRVILRHPGSLFCKICKQPGHNEEGHKKVVKRKNEKIKAERLRKDKRAQEKVLGLKTLTEEQMQLQEDDKISGFTSGRINKIGDEIASDEGNLTADMREEAISRKRAMTKAGFGLPAKIDKMDWKKKIDEAAGQLSLDEALMRLRNETEKTTKLYRELTIGKSSTNTPTFIRLNAYEEQSLKLQKRLEELKIDWREVVLYGGKYEANLKLSKINCREDVIWYADATEKRCHWKILRGKAWSYMEAKETKYGTNNKRQMRTTDLFWKSS
ncbi:unnamed protein product [Blepharisma stoltei]|uniref:Uncharacterized protein n=1 Tax=Blepharisma stoltei TaxID=1481888 RepID=A0AAU9JWK3_9CILI|nr:unnamed protein product [Blepharisma stoltei]